MRCDRCGDPQERTLVYVVDHREKYCWKCVQVLAQKADATAQESLAGFEND